jgi:AraC family transcriptional regulator
MVAGRRIKPLDKFPSPEAVRIVDFPETRVAIMAHRGDRALVPETVRRFILWRKANTLPPHRHATFNLVHGAPDQGPPEDFRLDLCVATDRPLAEDGSGVKAGVMAGGRCAVLRHMTGDDGLAAAVAWLCGEWLRQSGEEAQGARPFLQRFPGLPGHDLVVDIFLPLA